ncbi:hypothetical protein N658DRAFT_523880 [Parathielavia hyrcaniae]|uniref:SWIM-type domain-containing protein n=1 Tax=Parathielavia hyrcaniae TaxID=113614 RepID=A0AAN6T1J7_9PEZI|nr:hypothetical protein N658DRAFT_523880 [Parathielavia hyrcaniae]
MAYLQQPDTTSNIDSIPTDGSIPLADRQPLPTARTMLTTLINAIAAIPLLPAAASEQHDPGDGAERPNRKAAPPSTADHINNNNNNNNNNPLGRVPSTHRHLLVTLHVLFPGLVLPALDLLERGLVARVVLASSTITATTTTTGRRGGGSSERVKGRGGGDDRGGVEDDGDDDGSKAEGERRGGYEESVKQRQQQQQQIIDDDEEGGGGGGEEEERSAPATTTATTTATASGDAQQNPATASFYLVQSAASLEAEAASLRRRRKHSDGGGHDGGREETGTVTAKGYMVLLEAWHCSCAAFAFASVQSGGDVNLEWGAETTGPREHSGLAYGRRAVTAPGKGSSGTEAEAETDWSFGGMSRDGLAAGSGEGVPVCKHLLACLLAERWSAALGKYVVERGVGRGEMAGIVADI